MLQYAIYSVISPEGCASILWKSAEKAEVAAEAMGITADRLLKLRLIDEVIAEPLGGAHRDSAAMMEAVKNALLQAVADLQPLAPHELLEQRRRRLAAYGAFKET